MAHRLFSLEDPADLEAARGTAGPAHPILAPGPPSNDNEDASNLSADYIEAQRRVISHSGPENTFQMTPEAARSYTFRIKGPEAPEADGDVPAAAETLKLAYFMRSRGYDVGGTVVGEREEIWLFVVTNITVQPKIY